MLLHSSYMDSFMIYLSAETQLRLIDKFTRDKHFVKASELESMLNKQNKKKMKRFDKSLNLKICRELMNSQAYDCNKILKEIEC